MKTPRTAWYAEGLRFECTQCGACCRGAGNVWVSEERIREIAEFLEMSVEGFARRYLRRVDNRLSLTDNAQQDCVFWELGKGCTIYPVRPKQCRTFPFWPEHLESPEAWRALAIEVPGIGRGRRHDEGEIRRRQRKSKWSGS